MSSFKDSYSTLDSLQANNRTYDFFNLTKLKDINLPQLPFSIRILLENVLRNEDGHLVTKEAVDTVLNYNSKKVPKKEIPFMPARVVMQDFTGVPAVVDLGAMRNAMVDLGGKPSAINPIVRSDLVIDHSVQVDYYGMAEALTMNIGKEYERNKERYSLLRWAQESFENFSAVPPGTGIVHQVNLEYLASVVSQKEVDGKTIVFPDTLVGTDSHTTMINGLSVLGWGVGGIEAEAVMLGQPYYMLLPEVIGFKLTGELPEGATATDLVLTTTQMLRKKGVVGKFVEFYGPGLHKLSLPDRATLANMAPEYGATMGFFPIDEATLTYLKLTSRSDEQVELVERYAKAQGLFHTKDTPDPIYTDSLELDLGTLEPSLAGPKRPQDRVLMKEMKQTFYSALKTEFKKEVQEKIPDDRWEKEGGATTPDGGKFTSDSGIEVEVNNEKFTLQHGSVVISAITSCTNTSNPSVMIAAGLLAKNALERDIHTKPWVKSSMAPGSKVVPEYLGKAGLLKPLEEQKFNIVGYGCTTCIGNSGPLMKEIDEAITKGDLVVAGVLSGNRNFEGRIHASVRANYLASPPLVVAYALAGKVDFDFDNEPLGNDANDNPVYLRDIWPSQKQIKETIEKSLSPDMFKKKYGQVYEGDENWRALRNGKSEIYHWDEQSTYIKLPPFFQDMPLEPEMPQDIENALVLALLGDSVTTDHISPAGAIQKSSPAGQYLISKGVEPKDFNSYGSRRGNHEVMMRGTFANIRIRNKLVPDVEGGYTKYLPTGEQMPIYDAAMKYQDGGTPLLVIAGKEYGTGSSRDWAAKGTFLLGVKAVIAESYERIHRSNLIGMGVLPLQFKEGENAQTLGLTGTETFTIKEIANLQPGKELTVKVANNGNEKSFNVLARLDTPIELNYYRNGGILQTVLRQMVKE
jgi:aconitate hydratase